MDRGLVRFVATAAAFAAALSGLSCSRQATPKLFPVKGSAVFEGRPAAGAVLTFHRVGDTDKTNLPHAIVKADGTFELTTLTPGDGAAAGKYEVTVIWRKKGKARGDDDGGAYILPPRYLVADQSRLTAEVKEGPTDLPPFQFSK